MHHLHSNLEYVIFFSIEWYCPPCLFTFDHAPVPQFQEGCQLWRKRLHIQDLSEDDAFTHSQFHKVHLQEVVDKLWPRLQCFLICHRSSIKVNNGTNSLPYETLLLLVLYRLSRPRHIRNEMEGFFGIHKSKISTGILCMFHAMHALGVQYLDNPVIFHNRMPYYAERVYQKYEWTGDKLDHHIVNILQLQYPQVHHLA